MYVKTCLELINNFSHMLITYTRCGVVKIITSEEVKDADIMLILYACVSVAILYHLISLYNTAVTTCLFTALLPQHIPHHSCISMAAAYKI